MEKLTDTMLNEALDRLLAGEPQATVLDNYPAEADELRPLLSAAASLEQAGALKMPPPEALAADRLAFLEQVDSQTQPVSPSLLERLKGWVIQSIPWLSPKSNVPLYGRWPMSTVFVKVSLILALVLGTAGGVATVAADSLPGSPTYPIKLAMEKTRLALSNDPAGQANLHLTFAQERAQEMAQLARQGKVPEEATVTRMQEHLQQAFQLAAEAPEEVMAGILERARQMTQIQEQKLVQAQEGANSQARERLQHAEQVLAHWEGEAHSGLEDPSQFKAQYAHQHQEGPEPEVPGQHGECTEDCEPAGDQHQHQEGSQPEDPGQHGECGQDCEPAGDQHQHQEGPGAEDPGQHGECSEDCEPAGDQNQHQEGPGPEDPGQNGECTEDCDGDQNQNQNGQDADNGGSGDGGDHGGSGDGGGDGGSDGGGGSGDGGTTGGGSGGGPGGG